MPHPTLSPLAALVREHDHDRYLCTLFAPAAVREAWFALFAFNHELAAIPERVKEEMIGFMRFAWWREALDEIYAGKQVRKHPVAQGLAETVSAYRLPRAPLDALLNAREERLADRMAAPGDEYFRATSSGLLTLCALTAGETRDAALDALGLAWGYGGTARMTGDKEHVASAEAALSHAKPLPEAFLAFRDTVEFYLRRLKKGANIHAKAGFSLTASLCWRRFRRWLL